MKKIYGIIYKTTCLVNGKIYIGQTTCLNKKSYIGSGRSISLAIRKYGRENFIREVLKECYNQTELDEWEDLLIWEYNSIDKNVGYNIAKGSVLGAIGEMSHTKLPEVRTKMSEAAKGKIVSEETRAKMSASNKGRIFSEETRAKMSEASKGKTHSAETIAKLSTAKKGKNNPNYGKQHSEETRMKISECLKGITRSEETRAKISIPVLQYDKQGNFIAEYYGAKEAERQTGIDFSNITKCCRGKYKSAGGYIWKYK